MKTIYFSKAANVDEALRIQFGNFGKLGIPAKELADQGQALAQELYTILPGGTLCALLAELQKKDNEGRETSEVPLAPSLPEPGAEGSSDPIQDWRQNLRRKGMLSAVAILGAILVTNAPGRRLHDMAKQALEDIQA